MEPAIRYAKQAVALAPNEIDGYQRLCEVQLTAGNHKAALQTLDRAAKVETNDPSFWTRLGKLYLALLAQTDATPKPDDLHKVNLVFQQSPQARAGRRLRLARRGRLFCRHPTGEGSDPALSPRPRASA